MDTKIDSHWVGVGLYERLQKRQREPTPSEARRMERDSWFRPYLEVQEPTGRLCLRIAANCRIGRRAWADGNKQRVEDCLFAFMKTLLRVPQVREKERQAAEERRRRWEEEWERRREAQRNKEIEAARRTTQKETVESWHTSSQIGAFVAEAVSIAEGGDTIDDALEVAISDWARWAVACADSLDPFTPTKDGLEKIARNWNDPLQKPRW